MQLPKYKSRIMGLLVTAFLGFSSLAGGAWINPNSNSSEVVFLILSTNGAVLFPKTITGFDRITSTEYSLAGTLIDNWLDLSSILNLSQYAISASSVTAPAAPYATILRSGSAPTFTLANIKGVNGITASNDANGNVIVDGSGSNSVTSFFPPQTQTVTRFYYRPSIAPYNISYVDLVTSTNGYLYFDGTNFFALTTVAVGNATNATLFGGFLPAYYANYKLQTNIEFWDDAALDTMDVHAWEAGVNTDFEYVYRTNSSGVSQLVVRINAAGGTGDVGRLNSENFWTESNGFEKVVYLVNGTKRTGNGVTQADGASVGNGSSNLVASGSQSSVGGGFANTASAADSTIAGGNNNTASGTRSTVGGGQLNTANGTASTIAGGQNHSAGDYSGVLGGDDLDVSGQFSAGIGGLSFDITANYSFGGGRYGLITNADSVAFMWGQAATNPCVTLKNYSIVFLRGDTNRMMLGVNTANPTCEVQAASMMADSYYGTFKGDISQATGGTAASNANLFVETQYATNATTRRIIYVGATITNVVVNGFTTTVYFADTLSGGGSINFTQTWSVATTFGTTNAQMVAYGATGTIFMSTGASSVPQFRSLASLGAMLAANNLSDLADVPTARSNLGLASVVTNSQAFLDDRWAARSGQTNTVDFTNATLKVKTPAAGNEAATKSYVDSFSTASATNAVSKTSINNGTPDTGLVQVDFNDAGDGTIVFTNVVAGGTNRLFPRARGWALSQSTNWSIAPTNTIQSNSIPLSAAFSVIPGGKNNSASSDYAVVSGGRGNVVVSGSDAPVIGGGVGNTIASGSDNATIAGGYLNYLGADTDYGFIGGGRENYINGLVYKATIAGGFQNAIYADGGSIGGGTGNNVQGGLSSIGGGENNTILDVRSFIGGGSGNRIATGANKSTIGGGFQNSISNIAVVAVIGGGVQNVIMDDAELSFIGGGYNNVIKSNAYYSAIPAGQQVYISGWMSFAAGNKAAAIHNGSFVWADSPAGYNTGQVFQTTSTNQFMVRASGGMWWSPAGDGNTNLYAITATRFVTNIDVKNITPNCQGQQVYDTGSNILWIATGTTTNSWRGTSHGISP